MHNTLLAATVVTLLLKLAVMNQWTVPLEWNGGMEYWNDPCSPCYFFPEAVLGSAMALSLSGSSKFILAVCQSVEQTEPS